MFFFKLVSIETEKGFCWENASTQLHFSCVPCITGGGKSSVVGNDLGPSTSMIEIWAEPAAVEPGPHGNEGHEMKFSLDSMILRKEIWWLEVQRSQRSKVSLFFWEFKQQ